MTTVLFGMAGMIAAGVLWRAILGAEQAEAIRGHLARAVYEVFLPALVLHVMWRTPPSLNLLRVPAVAASCVLLCLLAAWIVYRDGGRFGGRKTAGAMLLASAFGNFTYLGLPVLTQTFGDWAQSVAIPFDLFASTPLLFTAGIMVAHRYGEAGQATGQGRPIARAAQDMARVPAIWAAAAGLALALAGLPMPAWLDAMLGMLGQAVSPLMLLAIGMALRWQADWTRRIPALLPMLAIQLGLMPLVAWGAALLAGLPEKLLPPVVVEGAMPTMVLGLVICDRFRLNASLYAEAVTLSTALSLLTLPLWLGLTG